MQKEVQGEVEEIVGRYRTMAQPDPQDLFRYMYDKPTGPLLEEWGQRFGGTDTYPASDMKEPTATGGKAGVNIRHAVNMALHEGLKRDPKMVIFGEDVGKNGGVFQVTKGLQDEFGPERVFDTPLSEVLIAGIFVGLSIGGLTPVAEFQFDGFTYAGLDHIIGHIARLRNRTRGRFSSRGVIRFPYGAGVRAPEHHSDSPEAYFSHTPGLKVVIPSNPYDAKGLLASCLREPNPVVFMEPKRLYDSPRVNVPEEEYLVPIGKAKVVRAGSDITLISYGAMMVPTLAAADELQSGSSVSAEVIDLRTISPFDLETIVESVKKTGRVVIVHEAQRSFGVGAEIAARLAEKAIEHLRGPVVRVAGPDTVVPLAKLEDFYIPNKEQIVASAIAAMNY